MFAQNSSVVVDADSDFSISSVPEIIAELRAGRIVILVDEEDPPERGRSGHGRGVRHVRGH